MRILQMIDSLAIGGAERMAVNYANALVLETGYAAIVATRNEGPLRNDIQSNVDYLFLDKKRSIDITAILKLRSFCRSNKIDVIHAHGTSFFTATLLKLIYFRIDVIWHDHNGNRDTQSKGKNWILWLCSFLFSGIIVVNRNIEAWAKTNLNCNNVIYLPNFSFSAPNAKTLTTLHGTTGKRILLLANLRHPKNHLLALKAFNEFRTDHPEWSLHFVGNDLLDAYSKSVVSYITKHALENMVYIYGVRTDVDHIIDQCDICILTSDYEGLPVTLLDYGRHRKAVISTSVGEVSTIIIDNVNGLLVPVGDSEALAASFAQLANNPDLRQKLAGELFKTIDSGFSGHTIIAKYLDWNKKN